MRKLATHVVEKVWGVAEPPFPIARQSDEPIGELWFTPPEEMPGVLVKHLFTSQRLSVQVHPNDEQARALGIGPSGKNECWLITGATGEARIAIGFERDVTKDEMREAALDGSIVDLLSWRKVARGDFFYIPAGTVHAIGEGVELVEIQQNCDITFRLFDYGRPRELHLDKGLEVALGKPYPAENTKRIDLEADSESMIADPGFSATYVRGQLPKLSGKALLVPIGGQLTCDGTEIAVGDCALVDEASQVAASEDARTIVVTPGTSS